MKNFLFVSLISLAIPISCCLSRSLRDSSSVKPADTAAVPLTKESGLETEESRTNSGQYEPNEIEVPKWYEMLTNVPGDLLLFFKDQYNHPDYPLYFAIAASTAGLIATDDITYDKSKREFEKNFTFRSLSNTFTEIGDGRTQFGLAAAFAAYGFAFNDARALRCGSQIAETVLASGGLVQIFKHITGRESPYVSTRPKGNWDWFPNQIEYHKHVPHYDAFPSGHLTTAIATVVVVAENYPEYKWIKPAGFTICTLVAAGMVNCGIHWYSDYPLAMFLGYYFGEIVVHKKSFTLANSKGTEISFLPYTNPYAPGITLSVKL